jgi:predicted HTH transcriptional regulator
MLNANGGTLYIGVADNSDITGLEVEIGKKQLYKTMDKYINAIKDTIKKQLSAASLKNIEYIPLTIHGQQILAIKCIKSAHQVFVKGKDTYVRVGPSTELLEGPDLITYSKERFD